VDSFAFQTALVDRNPFIATCAPLIKRLEAIDRVLIKYGADRCSLLCPASSLSSAFVLPGFSAEDPLHWRCSGATLDMQGASLFMELPSFALDMQAGRFIKSSCHSGLDLAPLQSPLDTPLLPSHPGQGSSPRRTQALREEERIDRNCNSFSQTNDPIANIAKPTSIRRT
jgi:hypothetical protein